MVLRVREELGGAGGTVGRREELGGAGRIGGQREGLGRTGGQGEVPVFFTTSSPSIYKGFEMVIDTAKILIHAGVAFEWRVAGLRRMIRWCDWSAKRERWMTWGALKIRLLGTLPEEAVADQLMNSDAYIQVSHIENSPNSVCEAMLAGVPVIASFAGDGIVVTGWGTRSACAGWRSVCAGRRYAGSDRAAGEVCGDGSGGATGRASAS